MPLTENYRVHHYQKDARGRIRDTGWQLVQYEGHGEGWEPVDTIFARGASGRVKTLSDVRVVGEQDLGVAPFNSSVLPPLVANSTDQ